MKLTETQASASLSLSLLSDINALLLGARGSFFVAHALPVAMVFLFLGGCWHSCSLPSSTPVDSASSSSCKCFPAFSQQPSCPPFPSVFPCLTSASSSLLSAHQQPPSQQASLHELCCLWDSTTHLHSPTLSAWRNFHISLTVLIVERFANLTDSCHPTSLTLSLLTIS